MGVRNKIWRGLLFGRSSDPEKFLNNFIKRCITNMSYAPCSSALSKSEVLKVAIIGSPNAGKSTIINQIVGRKVFAVSKKVHTTKSCAKAVYNEGTKQIIFLDTPGLVTLKEFEKYKLNKCFLQGGEDAIIEADLIGVVHDLSNPITRNNLDPKILRLLYLYNEKESFLILNKMDTLKSKRQLLEVSQNLTSGKLKTDPCNRLNIGRLSEIEIKKAIEEKKQLQWEHFSDVFMLSALLGTGVNDLRNYLLMKTYPGHWIYPATAYTDKNPVHIIEEAVRSRLLEHLPQEIPYSLDVQLEYLDMDNEDIITAVVLVCCSSERQERLVKGIRGERIKVIATEAEQDVADAFLSDVHLKVVITKKQRGNEISDFA